MTNDIRWAKTKALIGAANFMSPARDLGCDDDMGIYATRPFVPNSTVSLSLGFDSNAFMVCDIKLVFLPFYLIHSHVH